MVIDADKLKFLGNVWERLGRDPKTIDPGVRWLVIWLAEHDFDIYAAGDGADDSNHEEYVSEFGADLDYPHIFIQVRRSEAAETIDRLWAVFACGGLTIKPPPYDEETSSTDPYIRGELAPFSYNCILEVGNVVTQMVRDAARLEYDMEDALDYLSDTEKRKKKKLLN